MSIFRKKKSDEQPPEDQMRDTVPAGGTNSGETEPAIVETAAAIRDTLAELKTAPRAQRRSLSNRVRVLRGQLQKQLIASK